MQNSTALFIFSTNSCEIVPKIKMKGAISKYENCLLSSILRYNLSAISCRSFFFGTNLCEPNKKLYDCALKSRECTVFCFRHELVRNRTEKQKNLCEIVPIIVSTRFRGSWCRKKKNGCAISHSNWPMKGTKSNPFRTLGKNAKSHHSFSCGNNFARVRTEIKKNGAISHSNYILFVFFGKISHEKHEEKKTEKK